MLLCTVLYLFETKWPKQYFLNRSLSLQLFFDKSTIPVSKFEAVYACFLISFSMRSKNMCTIPLD